ncbi:WxcM-like%2C C-terminal [Campylobacter hyointestinalis subsp. hyointestinalis]|uniref:WxcM-like, C-terminal n=1 Tax=Campylobacter hyointestinalis subsp. hyointestinalis TaxID=91352 RepID=A0A0S4S293_CAMHY|nr:FdtA/QdtA family cupin domain-containing protein [Campylobacter hyointestinalis]PPB53533.1 hypothetical protein CDQ68_02445 [Campylobacter hyointestinalis subsp. hyointestinalis]PPB66238.1 hypothetical protein CDQ75_05425 [Campylobacter hyointestinalis subsp. hyointestinalis]PPB70970.1 hypothetical protein CDQ77_02465 [Campylobacter hyointestinalis subsp. hyointestinalis]CUU80057.1 WxcM-like%2C C-terminal [Campylobacter hyointestinalis subsp. hyointestinalis]
MAYLINLPVFEDDRGSLIVAEKVLPFKIKRFYYIYNLKSKRGGHRHKKAIQALICINGSCEVYINNGNDKQILLLNKPNQCLVLEPQDWHTMDKFAKNTSILVFASEYYDKDDYICEEYDDRV